LHKGIALSKRVLHDQWLESNDLHFTAAGSTGQVNYSSYASLQVARQLALQAENLPVAWHREPTHPDGSPLLGLKKHT